MSRHNECHVCAMLSGTGGEVIARSDHWTVTAAGPAPGVVMVMANRHDSGLADLSDAAACDMGPVLRSVSKAIVAAGGFDFVAALHLGDNSPHTHVLLIGRMAGEGRLLDTSPLAALAGKQDDDGRRARIIAAVGTAVSPGRLA